MDLDLEMEIEAFYEKLLDENNTEYLAFYLGQCDIAYDLTVTPR